MKVRRRARVAALQALFEIDIARHNPAVVVEQRLDLTSLPENGAAFVRQLVFGVLAHRPQLDQIIGHYAPEWPVEQLAVVDRNILRMALFELGLADTPLKVAINEAVEVAKIFGSDSAPRFVNGVLGSAVAQQREWAPKLAVSGNADNYQAAKMARSSEDQSFEEERP